MSYFHKEKFSVFIPDNDFQKLQKPYFYSTEETVLRAAPLCFFCGAQELNSVPLRSY